MMRHFGIRPHQCSKCEKRFTEACDLQKHMESRHSDDRPHTCPYCNWAFKDVSNLHGHCRRKHKIRLPTASLRRRQLGTHLLADDTALTQAVVAECRGKSADEPVSCVVCRGKFSRRSNMFEHMKRTHTKNLTQLLQNANMSLKSLSSDRSQNKTASQDAQDSQDGDDSQESTSHQGQSIISISPSKQAHGPVSLLPLSEVTQELSGIITTDKPDVEFVETPNYLMVKHEDVENMEDVEEAGEAIMNHPELVITSENEYVLSLGDDSTIEEAVIDDSHIVEINQAYLESLAGEDGNECPVCKLQFENRDQVLQHGRDDHNVDFENLVREMKLAANG